MQSAYLIKPDDSLEALLGRVREAFGRPAYAGSCWWHDPNRLCGLEGDRSEDFRLWGSWEAFWSTLRPWRRVEMTHLPKLKTGWGGSENPQMGEVLGEGTFLHIRVPALEDDDIWEYAPPRWKRVGLRPLLNYHHPLVKRITPEDEKALPEELKPFIRTGIRRPGHPHERLDYPAIEFHESGRILNPRDCCPSWAYETEEFEAEMSKGRIRSLRPPGLWPEHPIPNLIPQNQYNIVVDDPGGCIVCQGSMGERVHLGVTSVYHSKSWCTGRICRVCAHAAFDQWKNLLNAVAAEIKG